ncbi:MAG: phosphoglycerate dehydrogenase [Candidatus Omnitrophota bacterium]
MIRILVSDKLSEEGLKILKAEVEFSVDVKLDLKPEQLKEIIANYDALVVRSGTKVTKEIIEAGKNLKVIGRAGVGLDNVDLEAATKKGIIAMNSPAGNTISTAEHTMSMILALSRNIPQADTSMKKGEWLRSKFMGAELYGKTLGIIGLGRIGKEVARRSSSFGMKIIAYDPFISESAAKEMEVELVELKDLISRADYITLHIPFTDETKNMISEKELALMKKNVRIINCSRGGIIDEKALAKAVEEGRIAGCALDVYETEPPKDSPLLKCNNCVLTPHLGASTEEAQVNVAVEIAEAVRDALLGRGIRNAANFPSVEAEAYKTLAPFINLAEKLGLLASQLTEGRISQVDIGYSGEMTRHDLTSLTLALMKGILSPMVGDTVNFVNSLSLAQERQIKVQETKSSKIEQFANLISVELKTDKTKTQIQGTLFTNSEPRIVKINQFYVEALPLGYMLVIHNQDKPGIIGALGTILGKHKINIAGMTFGRVIPGGDAISVLNVDSPLAQNVLDEIKHTPNISSVKLIRL